jgi:hypothetical protein
MYGELLFSPYVIITILVISMLGIFDILINELRVDYSNVEDVEDDGNTVEDVGNTVEDVEDDGNTVEDVESDSDIKSDRSILVEFMLGALYGFLMALVVVTSSLSGAIIGKIIVLDEKQVNQTLHTLTIPLLMFQMIIIAVALCINNSGSQFTYRVY